jgi:hypothetical protein
MPGGNSNDPFCRRGIDFEGNRGDGDRVPSDFGHIDAKINNRKAPGVGKSIRDVRKRAASEGEW